MTERCPTCGAAVRVEVCGATHYMVPVDAERVRELETALHLIRTEAEGRDVLLFEIANNALKEQKR